VAGNAIEFRFILCRSDENGMVGSRVSKSPFEDIDNRKLLKRLGRHIDLSPKEGEWLTAAKQLSSIGAMACKAEVCYGRVQFGSVVGSVCIVAESARYIDRFMNILTGEFKARQFFKRLWRQTHQTVKKREGWLPWTIFSEFRP